MINHFLWNEPIFFLIVITGIYFMLRSQKVFSQSLRIDTDFEILNGHCGGAVRREMLKGFSRQLSEHVCFFSLAMLWAAISVGGAGALFWFAVFSLLLKGVLGALSALYFYYFHRDPDGGAAMMAASALRRRGRKGTARSFLHLLLQTAFLLLSLHPLLFRYGELRRISAPIQVAVCLLAAFTFALCTKKARWAADIAVPCLFFAFLIGALLSHLGNVRLIMRIVLTDAVQLNRFVFSHSNRGWLPTVAAGAWLCAGSFLLQAYSPGEMPEAAFDHPVLHAVYARLRCSLMIITQLLLGTLLLCFELEPAGNVLQRRALLYFVGFFGLRQIFGVLRRLRGSVRRSAALLALIPLALCLGGKTSVEVYFVVLSVVLAIGLFAAISFALSESGWYFTLLEDYRDRYVWHSTPHPEISLYFQDEFQEK